MNENTVQLYAVSCVLKTTAERTKNSEQDGELRNNKEPKEMKPQP